MDKAAGMRLKADMSFKSGYQVYNADNMKTAALRSAKNPGPGKGRAPEMGH